MNFRIFTKQFHHLNNYPMRLFHLFRPNHCFFLGLFLHRFLIIRNFRMLFHISIGAKPSLFHNTNHFHVTIKRLRVVSTNFRTRGKKTSRIVPNPEERITKSIRFVDGFSPSIRIRRKELTRCFRFHGPSKGLINNSKFSVCFHCPNKTIS